MTQRDQLYFQFRPDLDTRKAIIKYALVLSVGFVTGLFVLYVSDLLGELNIDHSLMRLMTNQYSLSPLAVLTVFTAGIVIARVRRKPANLINSQPQLSTRKPRYRRLR